MWTYNDTYLMHHGVKGMKWGIRKDRYESFRTRSLRSRIEDLDDSGRKNSRKRNRLYSKFNKSKNRDLKRKEYANKHPSQVRNVASYIGRGMGAGIGLGVAAIGASTAASLVLAKKGDLSYESAMKSGQIIRAGVGVVGAYANVKLIGQHVERARAINERQKNGKFDLDRR